MNFGMLGFAHGHAAGYAARIQDEPDFTLVATYDHDELRRAEATQRFGGDAHDDPLSLLSRSDVEAVIVMAETSLHADLVVHAAAAGKHVLCEKPIATHRADAIRMVEACQSCGVLMGTIFPMRYNSAIVAARESIRSGSIGRPQVATGTNNGQMPPGWFQNPELAGGGAMMDHVVHLADLLRWMFGTEIDSVYAESNTRLTSGLAVEDVGVVLLTLQNGMTASIDCSWNRPASWPIWGGLTLEAVGDRGVIEIDAFAEQIRLADDRSGRFSYVPWGGDAD
ncbi:MAG: Gfo/Idh/MocA family protein [Thermomicrobiales bacterium]